MSAELKLTPWDKRICVAVGVVCALVYLGLCLVVAGVDAWTPTVDNHFAHLADSWLHGQLHLRAGRPPGLNDWACFDPVQQRACPPGALSGEAAGPFRWYVSFPPFPAVLLLPWVALFGPMIPDRLVWAALAGLAPASLFWLLRRLALAGYSLRNGRADLMLTGLFAFGSVYFFCAVFANHQGTVFFAAHVVAAALVCLYLGWALDLRRPAWAGVALGLAVATRPTTALLGLFFVWELWRVARQGPLTGTWRWRLSHLDWRRVGRASLRFALPLGVVALLLLWHNLARFGDVLAFGHRYLQVNWRWRIEKWGLFNYHYLGRNLAVMLTSLPWLTSVAPHLRISGHGLALWITTPPLLLLLWPRRSSPLAPGLWAAAGAVAVLNLCYQNSGWLQFGYRFSLDYMPLLIVLLAVGGRSLRGAMAVLLAVAVVVNAFGALTFDRSHRFYHFEGTQQVLFQPD